jgi:hypothetical protein
MRVLCIAAVLFLIVASHQAAQRAEPANFEYVIECVRPSAIKGRGFADGRIALYYIAGNAQFMAFQLTNRDSTKGLRIKWSETKLICPADDPPAAPTIFVFRPPLVGFIMSLKLQPVGSPEDQNDILSQAGSAPERRLEEETVITPERSQVLGITAIHLLEKGGIGIFLLPTNFREAKDIEGKSFVLSIPMHLGENVERYEFEFRITTIRGSSGTGIPVKFESGAGAEATKTP